MTNEIDVRGLHQTTDRILAKLNAQRAARDIQKTMSAEEFEKFLEGCRKSARECDESEDDIRQVFGSHNYV